MTKDEVRASWFGIEFKAGDVYRVTEISTRRSSAGLPGCSELYEVGHRQGKLVLYRLPHRSSFLPIRTYSNKHIKKV